MSGDNNKDSKNNVKNTKINLFKNKFFWIGVNIFFILLFIILIFIVYKSVNKKDTENVSKTIEQEEVVQENNDYAERYIDGVFVEPGEENPQPVALMIDNHFEARPSAGLAKANLVIEAEAEGGITRYLAVYVFDEVVEKIGPIRSARPYFVDWANEYTAVYGHCGGSPEALVKIVQDGILDLNEFYNGQYFWRDENGVPSHNLYTSSENLKSYTSRNEMDKGAFLPWKYKNDLAKEERAVSSEIIVKYRIRSYIAMWRYDLENNNYIRYLGGATHKDSSGEIITAKNILIQVVPAEEIDNELRLRMEHIGYGDAKICLDGKCSDGIWEKPSSQARTRFYYESGDEVELNRGNTWINVVRPEVEVTVN